MTKQFFTSESVGAGHPDKMCDQIADHILDATLAQDPEARVAIEVMASNHLIVIGGEMTTTTYVDVIQQAWSVVLGLGYTENDFTIISNVNAQSPDIKIGVDQTSGEIGAGDQGTVFGYACTETPELMPLPITLAHALMRRAEALRQQHAFPWAKADMKAQVTIDYRQPENPRLAVVLMSVQHAPDYDEIRFRAFIKTEIMDVIAKQYHLNTDYAVLINPTGRFVIGGPIGDTGLTGRKIIVDTYGGVARHGGGAFSGKDYTKVDRSAAYAARWVAKTIVAAELAQEVEVQISYAIGVVNPLSVTVDTFGTAVVAPEILTAAVTRVFDLTPRGIITALDLKKPRYAKLATFGHFGRLDLDLPWEKPTRREALLTAVNELRQTPAQNHAALLK